MPRVALIGAGAIADNFYLPAIRHIPSLHPSLILVEPRASRAREIAVKYQIARHHEDYRTVLRDVDGVIIAAPHQEHVPLTSAFLDQGIHVLCEKPLAGTREQARALIAAAEARGVTLGVNQTRRLFPSTQAVQRLIGQGDYGPVTDMDFEEGAPFGWPAESPGYFGVASGGRGVLSDIGAHVLDLVTWWLDGTPAITSYKDDYCGGSEARCEISLVHGDVPVRVRLSWLSKLRNTYRVSFASGYTIEHGIYDWRNPILIAPSGRRKTIKTTKGPGSYNGFAIPLLTNFVAVMEGRAQPLVPALSVLPSLSIIEQCYGQRPIHRMVDPPFTVLSEMEGLRD
jgi:predicted dehydrogenase